MERIRILDTDVDRMSPGGVMARMRAFLDEPRPHFIVTANPEIVLRAHREPQYRELIARADLVVADGAGLLLASHLQGRPISGRMTGVRLAQQLLAFAEGEGALVFLAMNRHGLARFEEVKRAALRHHPGLRIAGADVWGGEPATDPEAAIVMCNFGAPEQEWWLDQHRASFPKARILIGVGGALDFISGKIRRAPRIMRLFGLEWLWRLALQPWRLPRIIRAVIVFPLTVITHRNHGV